MFLAIGVSTVRLRVQFLFQRPSIRSADRFRVRRPNGVARCDLERIAIGLFDFAACFNRRLGRANLPRPFHQLAAICGRWNQVCQCRKSRATGRAEKAIGANIGPSRVSSERRHTVRRQLNIQYWCREATFVEQLSQLFHRRSRSGPPKTIETIVLQYESQAIRDTDRPTTNPI